MINNTVQFYSCNCLSVIAPKDDPEGIHSLSNLPSPGAKIVLGTKDVSFGICALQHLGNIAYNPNFSPACLEHVLGNIVVRETEVSYAVFKAALGKFDLSFAYKSDIKPQPVSKRLKREDPQRYNAMAEYFKGVMSHSESQETARRLIRLSRSLGGEPIIKTHRFKTAAACYSRVSYHGESVRINIDSHAN